MLQKIATTNRDETTANIASQLFATLGHTQEAGAGMSEPLKTSMSIILANYMPDIFRVAGIDVTKEVWAASPNGVYQGNYSGMFPEGMPPGAVLTRDQVQNIMLNIGRGDNENANLAAIIAGWASVNDIVADHTSKMVDLGDPIWGTRTQNTAAVLSFLTKNAVGGTEADEADLARQAKLNKAAIDFIFSIPFLKAPADIGETGKFLWDTITNETKNAAKDAIDSALDSDPGSSLEGQQNDAARSMVGAWFNAMINNGHMSQESIDMGLASACDNDPSNDVLYQDSEGVYHVNPDAGLAYSEWLAGAGMPKDQFLGYILDGLQWEQ